MTARLNASYRGHTIIIEADKEPTGRWRWSYLVDGCNATVARAELPDAQTATREGVKAACARVNMMIAGARGEGGMARPGALASPPLPPSGQQPEDVGRSTTGPRL